ncbi:MAG: TonB-dependent receptor domain-containing protein [Rubricoccaceae bacterium]
MLRPNANALAPARTARPAWRPAWRPGSPLRGLLLRGLLLRGLLLGLLPGAPAAAQGVPTGALAGAVLDAETGRGLPGATVRLEGSARGTAADAEGRFRLEEVPAGRAVLAVSAVGYRPARAEASVPAGGEAVLVVRLRPDVATLAEVVVRAEPARLPTSLSLAGDALRERLAGSLAATLTGAPGLWQRTNGPAAAQPVVRGLAGDRVLVLEDGARTGDIATTAPDHAVTLDPLAARRIDVVRGPAALLYGSVVLGGVVDVVTEAVPVRRPARPSASAQVQGETVYQGRAASARAEAPLGAFAVQLEASARAAADTRTPAGPLPFTDLAARTLGGGLAWIGPGVRAGLAAHDVRQTYGVPSVFGGITLPGGHDGGVYVDLYRQSVRAELETGRLGPLERVRVRARGSRFYQAEFERGGFVGTEFGQALHTVHAVGYYGREGRARGGAGLAALHRDWAAAGSQTGTRPAVGLGGAAFVFHEGLLGPSPLGPLTLQLGARLDAQRLTPRDTTSSRIAAGRRLTGIRERRFAEPSGALALVAAPAEGLAVGVQLARSVRFPAVEELYSNGPHLASYAYEVGNPALGPEVGWGGEVFARLRRPRLRAEATLHASRIAGFVRYAPLVDEATGRPLLDYRLRRYEVYQATAGDAVFAGLEALAEAALAGGWHVEASTQGIYAAEARTGEGLPFIPPLHARLALGREAGALRGGLSLDAAAPQRRVPPLPPGLAACRSTPDAPGCPDALPGEFVPTAGRVLAGAWLGYRFETRGTAHALTLRVDNAFDRAYRDPLSRVKSVAPEAGRNVLLSYRLDL